MLHKWLTGFCLSIMALFAFSFTQEFNETRVSQPEKAVVARSWSPGNVILLGAAAMPEWKGKPNDLVYFGFYSERHGPFNIWLLNINGVDNYEFNTAVSSGVFMEPGTYDLYMTSNSGDWAYIYLGCNTPAQVYLGSYAYDDLVIDENCSGLYIGW
ncbi:MAG: hypothetical protein P0Y53_16255 [Candidatus Pseudobacter hemicellulosilyticus]|uniref:Uncharacterized protein n=1 Tax=Candidatus Pseudobacter hemicellulosilyticus TaxID=3121375 RepID=A0AAJ6BGE0_9BACT|nr:MAG: hypothetical protein P0Y53_16255 [Pseudobacter sp.]